MLHVDNVPEVPSTVGAQRPVSRVHTPTERGQTPKRPSILYEGDLGDNGFADAVARRLDRVLTPAGSAIFGGASGSATPRTPTPNGAGRDRDSAFIQDNLLSPSRQRSALKGKRGSSRGRKPHVQDTTSSGLQRHEHRGPRSLVSLLGVQYDDIFDTMPRFGLDETKAILQENHRLFTVDTASTMRGQTNRLSPHKTLDMFSSFKDSGGIIAPSRPDSAIVSNVAASRPDSAIISNLSTSRLASPTSMSLWSDDDEDHNANNDHTGLSRLHLRPGDYGIGRAKNLSKSSSAPRLLRHGGDPITLAKRSSAIAAAALRYQTSKVHASGHVAGEKNVLIVAASGSGSKPLVEESEPAKVSELPFAGSYRAATVPAGPKRRRAATDQVSSLVGYSADQFVADASCRPPRSAASDGLSQSLSVPSLLFSRTFNYFHVKDPRIRASSVMGYEVQSQAEPFHCN